MPLDLCWGKIRLETTARSVLDRAVGDLNRRFGVKLRLVRLSSGKVIACRAGDFWFCRVGDDGRPPQTRTLAVDTRPEQRTLLPADDPADFAECCDLLGFRTEDERGQFRAFLNPDPGPIPGPTAPVQGAS